MIWLTGNKGMLGADVEKWLAGTGTPFLASDSEVDITDYAAGEAFLRKNRITKLNWIINCAAYTAVDKAEEDSKAAFRINSLGAGNMALLARQYGARLVHISTDYVFDGKKEGAYTEEDLPNPASVYGSSKWEGEKQITGAWEQCYIIRTAWLYGKNGKNFVYTMLNLFKTRDSVRVVADQWGSPTYSLDLAAVIKALINSEEQSSTPHYGVYHFTNEGKTNWFEFTKAISGLALKQGLITGEIAIIPITTDQYPVKAKRPANSFLEKRKIRETFRIQIRPWQEALEDFICNEVKQG